MPKTFEMSWEGEPKYRWVKMDRGVRYRVSCEELGAMVWTKEASYKLANDWWAAKLREFGKPIEDVKAKMDALSERAMVLKMKLAAAELATEMKDMLSRPGGEHVAARIASTAERMATAAVVSQTTDLTLTHQAERFLAVEKLRGKKAGTFGDLAAYVRNTINDALTPTMDVTTIKAATVTDLYTWLRQKSGWSETVQHKVFGYFRRLIRFFWSEGLIELPRNLEAKIFTFDDGAKAIKVYDLADVRTMLDSLPRRLRLYALLALNCGMYGVDMAMMKKSEYANGRIRRKRTKTERTDAPEVDYLLWPETRELLDYYPSTHDAYVLTSSTGGTLWRSAVDENGKQVKVDLVGMQWRRGRGDGKASKPSITLKALRSVSATVIESHREYGRYKTHFLGHSPKSLADKNYAAPSKDLFDEIILWLRQQILSE